MVSRIKIRLVLERPIAVSSGDSWPGCDRAVDCSHEKRRWTGVRTGLQLCADSEGSWRGDDGARRRFCASKYLDN
jgi:hypothetical protein